VALYILALEPDGLKSDGITSELELEAGAIPAITIGNDPYEDTHCRLDDRERPMKIATKNFINMLVVR
jgi:hypothetical protein